MLKTKIYYFCTLSFALLIDKCIEYLLKKKTK